MKRLLLAALAAFVTVLVADIAQAQPAPTVTELPLERIAPKSILWSGAIACDTSSIAYFEFEWDSKGDHDEYLLFPDTYTITLTNTDADGIARCTFSDDPAMQMGAGSGVATMNDCDEQTQGSVNGDGPCGGPVLSPNGGTWTTTLDVSTLTRLPGYRSGVCQNQAAQTRYRNSTNVFIYGGCGGTTAAQANAMCTSKGGMGTGNTCNTTAATITARLTPSADVPIPLRGKYLGCRCTAAATIDAVIWAK